MEAMNDQEVNKEIHKDTELTNMSESLQKIIEESDNADILDKNSMQDLCINKMDEMEKDTIQELNESINITSESDSNNEDMELTHIDDTRMEEDTMENEELTHLEDTRMKEDEMESEQTINDITNGELSDTTDPEDDEEDNFRECEPISQEELDKLVEMEKVKSACDMRPAIIKPLDEVVVNRIGAGEVVQRPANALKELIENSLDAKATSIQVTVKEGGLKFLQIQDNGTGIRKEDLAIVCERYTTSKLANYEDLMNIATFGFRGEALASISHVAHLTIQTKTIDDICAYKASYQDGKLKEDPKPCAGNQGTIITIEDLFYNMQERKMSLKSPREEFQMVNDVINKYAVHNSKVGFTLKKVGDSCFAVYTKPTSTIRDNIDIIYGKELAQNLLQVQLTDEVHKFKMKGCISHPSYSGNKKMILFFINNRLVESHLIKLLFKLIYTPYLMKGVFPFGYISLEVDPTCVDVNVHPTKNEVHFLNEDKIISKIKIHLETVLANSGKSRTFYQLARHAELYVQKEKNKKDESGSDRIRQDNMIRTDSNQPKLEKFVSASKNMPLKKNSSEVKEKRRETKLYSILSMRKEIEQSCSLNLRKLLSNLVFVGIIDLKRALIQSGTSLYVSSTKLLSRELFFQLLLYNFKNFKAFKFHTPLSIKELILIALDCEESGYTDEDGPKEELAQEAVDILVTNAPLMKEYFNLVITDDGMLETLPVLLEDHKPAMVFLPMYMLKLATEVEWGTEEECFDTFICETSMYYSKFSKFEEDNEHNEWTIEHVIYPAIKQYLIPGHDLKGSLFEVACLPNLYKVFERC